MRKLSILIAVLTFTCLISCKETKTHEKESDDIAYNYSAEKTIAVDSAAVVTAHPLASEVGKDILKQGGNAIDASIAIQYALAVVYPGAGNIGGGGFMVFHTADGKSGSIDFRETAPAGADRDMYLDDSGDVIDNKSWVGPKAVGVPGTVAGSYLANEKYGKLNMKKLIEPAIKLAREGFVLTELEANHLNDNEESFKRLTLEKLLL